MSTKQIAWKQFSSVYFLGIVSDMVKSMVRNGWGEPEVDAFGKLTFQRNGRTIEILEKMHSHLGFDRREYIFKLNCH